MLFSFGGAIFSYPLAPHLGYSLEAYLASFDYSGVRAIGADGHGAIFNSLILEAYLAITRCNGYKILQKKIYILDFCLAISCLRINRY
jgi:hypothetical protein